MLRQSLPPLVIRTTACQVEAYAKRLSCKDACIRDVTFFHCNSFVVAVSAIYVSVPSVYDYASVSFSIPVVVFPSFSPAVSPAASTSAFQTSFNHPQRYSALILEVPPD